VNGYRSGASRRNLANPGRPKHCLGTSTTTNLSREGRYKSPKEGHRYAGRYRSRNGNLLLNFPLPNSGALDSYEVKMLDEITRWMAVNSEGIYSTVRGRYSAKAAAPRTAAVPGPCDSTRTTAKDLTAKMSASPPRASGCMRLSMGLARKEAVIKPLGTTTPHEVANVAMLGFKGKLQWSQGADGLRLQMPPAKPCDHGDPR